MKHVKTLALMLGIWLCCQMSYAQTKNILLQKRVRPKAGMEELFVAKMEEFARTHFQNGVSFRVQYIYGGPNDRCYLISPSALADWEYFDNPNRPDALIWKAFEKEMNPLLEMNVFMMLQARPELGHYTLSQPTAKATIMVYTVRPGMTETFERTLQAIKPFWEKQGVQVNVYRFITNNHFQYSVAYRHPSGWKDKALTPGSQLKQLFIAQNGAAAWNNYMKDRNLSIESAYTQLHSLRPLMSTK